MICLLVRLGLRDQNHLPRLFSQQSQPNPVFLRIVHDSKLLGPIGIAQFCLLVARFIMKFYLIVVSEDRPIKINHNHQGCLTLLLYPCLPLRLPFPVLLYQLPKSLRILRTGNHGLRIRLLLCLRESRFSEGRRTSHHLPSAYYLQEIVLLLILLLELANSSCLFRLPTQVPDSLLM